MKKIKMNRVSLREQVQLEFNKFIEKHGKGMQLTTNDVKRLIRLYKPKSLLKLYSQYCTSCNHTSYCGGKWQITDFERVTHYMAGHPKFKRVQAYKQTYRVWNRCNLQIRNCFYNVIDLSK